MVSFRDSRTSRNLMVSFAAECQAQARYRFYAARAMEENYIQASRIFQRTADQEHEHALRFFKFFNGGEIGINASFPAGILRNTFDNLISSAKIENDVHTRMYPEFSGIAREEGLYRAAETWDAIITAEMQHEKNFLVLADNIQTGGVFRRDETVKWHCITCGYIHHGREAPEKCPACVRPPGHFELLSEIL